MKIFKHLYKYLQLVMLATLAFSSCKKFIEVPLPTDQLTTEFVFTNDSAAVQTITGVYSKMMENMQRFSAGDATFFCGMSADELYYYTPDYRIEFVTNQINIQSGTTSQGTLESNFWNSCYSFIYAANKSIEGASASTSLSSNIRSLVIGEAKFIRAFCYFHLINLFGDVPLVTSTDYQVNQSIPRTAVATIYQQIIGDLKDAQNLLLTNYPTTEKVRPNKLAASALLARVYLYNKDWANAEAQASLVINSGNYSLPADPNTVFQISSNEIIWQLRPVNPSRNTWEGLQIIPASNSTTPTYLLTNALINSFEPNDKRYVSWVKTRLFSGQTLYYPYKYKVRTGSTLSEYYVVMRLAEQFLIRAEARANQNNISGAASDINIIRTRAGLPNTNASTVSNLLSAIEQERRIELFAEWGHRWFDLKRTDRANSILGALKSSTWQPTDMLWPIPQSQINLNPALTQNPGY